MDEQTLERLRVDERLGELDGDVRLLLEAYLEIKPDASARSEQSVRVVDQATKLLRQPGYAAFELPPLRSAMAEPVHYSFPKRAVGSLAIAASLMLAFWLGNESSSRRAVEPDLRAQVGARGTDIVHATSFWSVRNLVGNKSSNSDTESSVHWKSPLERPEVRS